MSGRLLGVGAGLVVALVMLGAVVVLDDDGPAPPAEDSVDVGFLRDMADHHEQAVRMSLLVIPNGASPAVRDVAVGVIASQRHDLGRIDAWLGDWGLGRGSPTRRAMAWMGHAPVAPSGMPGMATQADLDLLGVAIGTDAEGRFLELMIEHHRAGVTMAEHAAAHATTDKVVRLAELIAAGQREEILELTSLQQQLVAAGTLVVPER